MFERFTKDAREIAAGAREEAIALGARRVEAEHLLLALARRGVAGLDRETILDALEDEQRRSLAAVGVSLDAFDLPAPAPSTSTPRFGATAKSALERTLQAAVARGDRRIAPGHILLALVRPRTGTVPRALEVAGLPTSELSRRAHDALT